MPRQRNNEGNGAENPTPDASSGDAVVGVVEMEPPARTRAVKHTLSDEQLHAFAEALTTGKWAGTGETFNGDNAEEAEKKASNTARIWRREIARYLNCEEREIRTRIWETAEKGHYTCAVKLRDGSKVKMPETATADGNGSADGDAA